MGVFSKKDGKSSEGSTNDSKALDVSSGSVAEEGTLGSWFKKSKDEFQSWKSKSCEWCDSPEMKEFNEKRKEFADNFCHPMGNFYRSFPEDLTNLKWSLFGQYNYRQRLFGLEFFTLFTAIYTLRARRSVGVFKRLMLSIRNSSIAFFLGGLVVAPEIYNPLIKGDF